MDTQETDQTKQSVPPEEKPKTTFQEVREALDKSAQGHAEVLEMVTDLLNALRSRLDSEDLQCQ